MVAYLKFIYVNVTEPPLSAKLSIYVCHIQHDMYSCMHIYVHTKVLCIVCLYRILKFLRITKCFSFRTYMCIKQWVDFSFEIHIGVLFTLLIRTMSMSVCKHIF